MFSIGDDVAIESAIDNVVANTEAEAAPPPLKLLSPPPPRRDRRERRRPCRCLEEEQEAQERPANMQKREVFSREKSSLG